MSTAGIHPLALDALVQAERAVRIRELESDILRLRAERDQLRDKLEQALTRRDEYLRRLP